MQYLRTYPETRLRRTRQAGWIRDIVKESYLKPSDLIQPVFVREDHTPADVPSFQDVKRQTIKELETTAKECVAAGIKAIALFPSIEKPLKTADAKEAYNSDNLMCRATRAIKAISSDLGIIVDVALDPYTDHGHDGIVCQNRWGQWVVDNEKSNDVLAQQALCLAEAGVDIVAPSDMMDGRIMVIRQTLDQHYHSECMILSYAAKYASSFYGPFRDALGVSGLGHVKDKKTYQMDFHNADEALHEVAQDLHEGADLVMVKPAQCYQDVIFRVSQEFKVPVLAYHISGEYAVLMNAVKQGIIDEERAFLEVMTSIKRSGARAILTYGALKLARNL